ncbi:hypothetical protein PISMIDRAFT_91581 [Pisolithus microcarpus 441]|uniref:Amidase domain-containing protein n=1 Tax=Pisolithus microcarpus 441 TaxID=765257 RepID=A0A0C9ZG69_9AGAM|nr:hypothetical protein PISMIDRAFT_91581 [Pisolithus microcarpus 441]
MGNQRNAMISSKQTARGVVLASAPSYDHLKHAPFTNATATEIVQRISTGEWTASQVLEAYIARAAQAQHKTNCLTEVLFEDARLQASQLDEEFATTQKVRGRLHGVPMSFKDQFEIAGYDTTIGFTHWANKPSTDDAFLVSLCRAEGAIIIVKTNVPQTMFAFECSNPLWGRTLNPWNAKYTCGGSTGGGKSFVSRTKSSLQLKSQTFLGDHMFPRFFSQARTKSVLEFCEYTNRRNEVEEAWYNEVWDKYQFDGIIAPVQALPVIPHGACAYLSGIASTTVSFNVIDSPVGIVPVTRVDASLDQLSPNFKPGETGGSTMFEKWMYQNGSRTVYNPQEMAGIPVGVQIVGRKWDDEKVLAMMRVVDEALGPRGFGPGSWETGDNGGV